ncbi:MAG: HD-GYP domain-containing protein [Candidatus Glassbacteria bacterium]|nr:HD-GYP domain-containing protein [Candidatus Glassbacteria bacterium]
MKLISLDALEPGKVLGRAIFNEKGTLLLGAGVAVTSRYLRRLKEMGYSAVYIEEKGYEDIEVKDVISDKTRIEAVSTISETFQTVRESSSSDRSGLDKNRVSNIADKIVDDLTGSDNKIMDLIDLKSFDNYTFLHSVNVSVLTVMVASNSGRFNTLDLRDMAMGSLLHDIGMAHVPIEVVQKQGRLTGAEFRLMKKHTQIGFEILQHKSSMKPVISCVPLQHQEYYNGTGYPNGLAQEKIHIYSRYTAIADVFDALTSDRCFKRRLPPHAALQYLSLGKSTHFDSELLKLFARHVATFPVGTTVMLNSGETAVVMKNNQEQMDRPLVRVLKSPDGKEVDKAYEVDLTSQTEYSIRDIVP